MGQREKDGGQPHLSVFLRQLERDLLPSPPEGPSKFCSVRGKMLARNTSGISGDHCLALALQGVLVRPMLDKDRN